MHTTDDVVLYPQYSVHYRITNSLTFNLSSNQKKQKKQRVEKEERHETEKEICGCVKFPFSLSLRCPSLHCSVRAPPPPSLALFFFFKRQKFDRFLLAVRPKKERKREGEGGEKRGREVGKVG